MQQDMLNQLAQAAEPIHEVILPMLLAAAQPSFYFASRVPPLFSEALKVGMPLYCDTVRMPLYSGCE